MFDCRYTYEYRVSILFVSIVNWNNSYYYNVRIVKNDYFRSESSAPTSRRFSDLWETIRSDGDRYFNNWCTYLVPTINIIISPCVFYKINYYYLLRMWLFTSVIRIRLFKNINFNDFEHEKSFSAPWIIVKCFTLFTLLFAIPSSFRFLLPFCYHF